MLEHQASIFNCFYAFMSRFLCNTFRSDNFCTLKCSLAHFTLLLRFHDPQLAQFLAQFSVDPELFAMSWFLTAFAHGTEIGTVETVWDALIIHDDSTLIYFVAVATIMHFRDRLLNSQVCTMLHSALRFRRCICLPNSAVNTSLSRSSGKVTAQKNQPEIAYLKNCLTSNNVFGKTPPSQCCLFAGEHSK